MSTARWLQMLLWAWLTTVIYLSAAVAVYCFSLWCYEWLFEGGNRSPLEMFPPDGLPGMAIVVIVMTTLFVLFLAVQSWSKRHG